MATAAAGTTGSGFGGTAPRGNLESPRIRSGKAFESAGSSCLCSSDSSVALIAAGAGPVLWFVVVAEVGQWQ